MNLSNREWYLFQKKSLLILLYLYYINDVSYDGITFKSFGMFSSRHLCDYLHVYI